MNIDIMSKIPAKMKPVAIKAQKHAPEAMVIIGAGMVIGAAVNACRQTIKAHDILEQANQDLDKIEKAKEIANPEDYTESDAKSDRLKVYSKTAVGIARTYGSSVIIGTAGLALMFGAHKILRDRNTALTIAYSNLFAAYNAYREKVVEAIGEEKEFQLRSGYSKQEVDYIDEDGNEKKSKSAKVLPDTGTGHSIYARIFDETCSNWSPSPSANLTYLRSCQQFANDKLRSEGVVFLNDVYQMLGFPRTSEGQIVGWVWNPDDKSIDSYIDFGIYDKIFKSAVKRDFINAHEPCIWLDFNVDGVVYDLL